MQYSSLVSILFLSASAYAHFELKSPAGREADEAKMAEYPCGGGNVQSGARASFPLSGGNIQLDLGHDRSALQVNLAIGNVAVDGGAFTTTIVPIFLEEGPGDFCIGGVQIPASLGLKEGDNATIQVITNGDPSGGLYNCADITFSASAAAGECKNSTGLKAVAYTGSNKQANETGSSHSESHGSSSAASAVASATSSAASAKSSNTAAGVTVNKNTIFVSALAVFAFAGFGMSL